jgi:hypothetical protein
MSVLVILIVFVAAFFVALLRGVAWAFIAVYIPALILLNQLPEIQIPHAPVAAQFAPLYAILLAMPFRKESMRFRLCSVDIIFFLLLISATITAWSTEVFETGINTIRTDFLTLVAPYLLARICYKDFKIRLASLNVLIGVLVIVAVSALIEFRLTPYFYLHMLQSLGMGNFIEEGAYERYGFFRASGTVNHPIYFGNMCLVILGLLAVLAKTSGKSLKSPLILTSLLAAVGCIISSISFTPLIGSVAGTGFLMVLISSAWARKLVFPLTMLVIAVMFFITYHVATKPLGAKPDGEAAGSLYTREMIVKECWYKSASAGFFGLGIRPDLGGDEDFDLKSVDNTYMQFTLTHGYVYVTLWISIAVFFSWRMTRAFGAVTHPSQIFPLAACTATVLGLMISMYTVWAGAGALYTSIWVIMVGLSNTLIDSVLASAKGVPVVSAAGMSAGLSAGGRQYVPGVGGPMLTPQLRLHEG